MTSKAGHSFFSTSAALQDYLLREAGPGALVVAPHQRLARQVWQRQRRAELAAGRPAWEPLPLKTLQAWLRDIFSSLWPEVALAPHLRRLSLWRQAIRPPPPCPAPPPTSPGPRPWTRLMPSFAATHCSRWGRRPCLPFMALTLP